MTLEKEIRRPVTVTAKTRAADDVAELLLTAADGSALESWEPGAHITLHLPDGQERQYSLCGADRDSGTWTIAVHRAPGSRGGSRLIHDDLSVGDTVAVSGPRNNFPLEAYERYVLIAGGIGVTPILAMARELRERPGADFAFLYCGRTRSMMAYAEETAVVSGVPDHRDSVLSEEERAEGALIMPCVSRSRTAEIELDLF